MSRCICLCIIIFSCRSFVTAAEPWQQATIGSGSGKADAARGSLRFTASGLGYQERSDQLFFRYLERGDDFVLTAHVNFTTKKPPRRANIGLMVRESLDPGARSAFIHLGAERRRGALSSRRFRDGKVLRDYYFGNAAETGAWFRIIRYGDVLSVYDSADGKEWKIGHRFTVGYGVRLPGLNGRAFAGIAVASGRENETVSVVVDHLKIEPLTIKQRTTWFGNSSGVPVMRVGMDADRLAIDPTTGDVYNSGGDEWTKITVYRASDGEPINSSRLKASAITHDGTHLYVACKDRKQRKKPHCGLRRYGKGNAKRTLSDLMSIHANDGGLDVKVNDAGDCEGLAVDTRRKELFVSDTPNNQIVVYDTADWPKRKRAFPIEAPADLAFDPQGRLWVLQKALKRVVRYSVDGNKEITLSNCGQPHGITVGQDGKLYVADAGPDSQIKIFAEKQGRMRQVGTLGAKGGIHSGVPGQVASDKLNHPQDVAVDAKGNIYVGCGMYRTYPSHQSTGGEFRAFTPDGKLLWEKYGLEFVDTGDFDPADSSVVYTQDARYEIDFNAIDRSEPNNKTWRYAAMTVDRDRYPDDMRMHRGHGGASVRRIGGQKYLFTFDQGGSNPAVFRFEKGSEVAIPCGLISYRQLPGREKDWPRHAPEFSSWIWTDLNADGQMDKDEFTDNGKEMHMHCVHVSADGSMWSTGRDDQFLYFAPPVISANGVLAYSPAKRMAAPVLFTQPKKETEARKLWYDTRNDRLYVMGFTKAYPKKKGTHFGAAGSVVARYDNWKKDGFKETPAKQYILPFIVPGKGWHGANQYRARNLAVCGSYLFVLYNWSSVHVYEIESGKEVAVLKPGPEVGGWCGLVDTHPGFNVALHDGVYRVIMEDDVHIKQLIYHWQPEKE